MERIQSGKHARLRIEIGRLAPRTEITTRPLRPTTNPYAGEVVAGDDL